MKKEQQRKMLEDAPKFFVPSRDEPIYMPRGNAEFFIPV